jgi:hypothetical protein
MREMELIIAAIAYACGISSNSPDFGRSMEQKTMCIEKVVNCAVGPGGDIDREILAKCIKKYTAKSGSSK